MGEHHRGHLWENNTEVIYGRTSQRSSMGEPPQRSSMGEHHIGHLWENTTEVIYGRTPQRSSMGEHYRGNLCAGFWSNWWPKKCRYVSHLVTQVVTLTELN